MRPPLLLALVGPTATGKSELALRVARALPFPVEIVSCDAFQVYRGLDIGSGKPPPAARRSPRHHLFDVLAPDDRCTAGRYAELAVAAVREIGNRGAVPLVVGGSGLYFRALRDGIFESPAPDPALRDRLQRISCRPGGDRWLARLLARLDPDSLARIHRNDRVRRIRALEVALAVGQPISRLQTTRRPPLEGARWIVAGLDPPRELLAARIAARVRGLFEAGLVGEVRRLHERYRDRWPGRLAIGYREVLAALADPPARGAPDERFRAAEFRTVLATRRYAKRQRTWFRAEREIVWHHGDPAAPAVEAAILRQFRREENPGGLPGGTPAGSPVP